jgi:hypothetical protein
MYYMKVFYSWWALTFITIIIMKQIVPVKFIERCS